jgi:hypothetical protein
MRDGRNWNGVLRTLRSFLQVVNEFRQRPHHAPYFQDITPIVRTILVVVHQLEAVHIVHELDGNVVSNENDVVSGSGVCTEVGLSSFRNSRVAHERRPHKTVNGLVPQNSTECRVVEAGEEANDSLIVVFADLLSNETCLVLVVYSKTSIHVNLINEGRGLEERELGGLLLFQCRSLVKQDLRIEISPRQNQF